MGSSQRTKVKYPVKGSNIGQRAPDDDDGEGDDADADVDAEAEAEAEVLIKRPPVIKKSGIAFAFLDTSRFSGDIVNSSIL